MFRLVDGKRSHMEVMIGGRPAQPPKLVATFPHLPSKDKFSFSSSQAIDH